MSTPSNQRSSVKPVDWDSLPEVIEYKRAQEASRALHHTASVVFRQLCKAGADIYFADLYLALGRDRADAAVEAAGKKMLEAVARKVSE